MSKPRNKCQTCEARPGEPCVTTVDSSIIGPKGTPMIAYHAHREPKKPKKGD